jgi:uncharacterized membrane protein YphA (DoxX/SURF4 family)/peroxiredoxin
MKLLITICRILVGSLFIVSGLIKVNDALGFSYKLEEYFDERALGMAELIPYALPIAVFIVIGEVLLGVAVLLGAWPKLTNTLILAMTVFFTWLTYYTAHCDPTSLGIFQNAAGQFYIDAPQCVLTCGCFGEAIPLEPIESFYKDVVLLIFVIPVFIAAWRNKIKLNTKQEDLIYLIGSVVVVSIFCFWLLDWMFPILFTIVAFGVGVLIKKMTNGKEVLMALGVLAVCVIFQYWTLVHLPIKDYRAYAIGSDIYNKTRSADELGLEPPKFVNVYVLKNVNTGEEKEMDSDAYLAEKVWQDKSWEILKDKTYSKKVSDGYEPKIKDFAPTNQDGDEVIDELLQYDRVFLLVSSRLDKFNTKYIPKINEFAKQAEADGAKFFGISSTSGEELEQFRFTHQTPFEFLVNDGTELKIIVRSNPGLVYLEKGVVKNMWAGIDIPDYAKQKAKGFAK